MTNFIFWDIKPRSPLKSTDVSEEHVSPSLGLKVIQIGIQHEVGSKQRALLPASCWFLAFLTL
jgi:hypothetical protein